MKWRLPIPPRVADAMDDGAEVGDRLHARGAGRLRLSGAAAQYRPDGRDPRQRHGRGEALSAPRCALYFPEYARELDGKREFRGAAGGGARATSPANCTTAWASCLPQITEDTMPGELANCIAGRIANIFNFHGPNYVCDAACASAMAAINCGRRRADRERFRRGRHRRHRPQHGRVHLRQVLQDRRAFRRPAAVLMPKAPTAS